MYDVEKCPKHCENESYRCSAIAEIRRLLEISKFKKMKTATLLQLQLRVHGTTKKKVIWYCMKLE